MVQVLKGEVCSSKGQRKKRSHSSLDAASTDEQFVCTGTYLLTVDVWKLYSSLKTLIVKLTCRLFQIIRENSFYDDPRDFHPGDHNVWTDGRMQAEHHN